MTSKRFATRDMGQL